MSAPVQALQPEGSKRWLPVQQQGVEQNRRERAGHLVGHWVAGLAARLVRQLEPLQAMMVGLLDGIPEAAVQVAAAPQFLQVALALQLRLAASDEIFATKPYIPHSS